MEYNAFFKLNLNKQKKQQKPKKSKTIKLLKATTTNPHLSPLVVSLSRTRKVPLLFSRLSSSLSESRRVILPKYHLQGGWRRKHGTHKTRLVRGKKKVHVGRKMRKDKAGGEWLCKRRMLEARRASCPWRNCRLPGL